MVALHPRPSLLVLQGQFGQLPNVFGRSSIVFGTGDPTLHWCRRKAVRHGVGQLPDVLNRSRILFGAGGLLVRFVVLAAGHAVVQSSDRLGCHLEWIRCGGDLGRLRGGRGGGIGLREGLYVEAWGRYRVFPDGVDQPGLQHENVLPEIVDFGLRTLEVRLHDLIVSDLLLQALDVPFFSLAKCSLD